MHPSRALSYCQSNFIQRPFLHEYSSVYVRLQALQFIDLSARLVITLVIRHSSHSTPLICICGTSVARPLCQQWCFLTASIKIFSVVDSRGATRQPENNQMLFVAAYGFLDDKSQFHKMKSQAKELRNYIYIFFKMNNSSLGKMRIFYIYVKVKINCCFLS